MAKPLIQLALDSLDFDQTISLAEQTAQYVDIFEIGTPCIKHNGIKLVKELRERFPKKLILVDLKTMDAGEYEAAPFQVAFTKRAKEIGASILLISAKADSTIGDMADAVFQVGRSDQYGKVVGMPMGTVFELSTLSFLEALISHVIHEKGIPEEVMRTRHANLE